MKRSQPQAALAGDSPDVGSDMLMNQLSTQS